MSSDCRRQYDEFSLPLHAKLYIGPAMRFLFIIAILFLFSGCATSYQPKGFTGGFSETRLAPDTFRVRFSGNGRTSTERAEDFALLRAADLSTNAGFSYFSIITSTSGVAQSSFQTPGQSITTVQAQGNGFVGSTTYIPGQNINIFKPRSGLMIKCFKDKPAGVDTFDARFLQQELRRKYHIDAQSQQA